MTKIKDNAKYIILFKIKTRDGCTRNISSFQIIDKTGLETLKIIFIEFWTYKSDLYSEVTLEEIIFTYRLLEYPLAPQVNCIFNYPTDFDKSKSILPKDFANLPKDRLFTKWSFVEEVILTNSLIYLACKNNLYSYFIKQVDNEYFITIYYKAKPLYYFHDIYNPLSESDDIFIRIIGNIELYYHEGECYLIN